VERFDQGIIAATFDSLLLHISKIILVGIYIYIHIYLLIIIYMDDDVGLLMVLSV